VSLLYGTECRACCFEASKFAFRLGRIRSVSTAPAGCARGPAPLTVAPWPDRLAGCHASASLDSSTSSSASASALRFAYFPLQSEVRQQHTQDLRLVPESHFLDDVRLAVHDLDGGYPGGQVVGNS